MDFIRIDGSLIRLSTITVAQFDEEKSNPNNDDPSIKVLRIWTVGGGDTPFVFVGPGVQQAWGFLEKSLRSMDWFESNPQPA